MTPASTFAAAGQRLKLLVEQTEQHVRMHGPESTITLPTQDALWVLGVASSAYQLLARHRSLIVLHDVGMTLLQRVLQGQP